MIYTIENEKLRVEILYLGASILSMQYFDGIKWIETTLQYEDLKDYENNNTYYLNSVIGPHSGRIKNGRYYDGDELVELEVNDGKNHLHGGATGFHTLKFDGVVSDDKTTLTLRAFDDVNKCDITLTYSLNREQLDISYHVKVFKDQVMNMTQHTYFNLSGEDTIEDHRISVPAEKVCFLDESGAPERLVDVSDSFDLRSAVQVGEKMAMTHPQFEISGNIDHPFLVNDGLIKLESDKSGIGVAIGSDRPYAVVYTGNYFLQEREFKGLGYSKVHQAVAIEPQYLPNDINLGLGENQLIRKNEDYNQQISYKFYTI